MRSLKVIATFLTPCIIMMIAVALVGCEDDPSTDGLNAGGDTIPSLSSSEFSGNGGLTVSPDSAQVTHIGQQIEFEVTGGHWPYTWTVANGTRGSIAEQQTDPANERFSAVYTANEVAANTVIVRDSNGRTGTREVTAAGAGGPTLDILPSGIAYSYSNLNTTVTLAAIGGTPPYTWLSDAPAAAAAWFSIAPATTSCVVTINLAGAGPMGVAGISQIDYYVTLSDQAESSDQTKFTLIE